jgi:hypothetical protein
MPSIIRGEGKNIRRISGVLLRAERREGEIEWKEGKEENG